MSALAAAGEDGGEDAPESTSGNSQGDDHSDSDRYDLNAHAKCKSSEELVPEGSLGQQMDQHHQRDCSMVIDPAQVVGDLQKQLRTRATSGRLALSEREISALLEGDEVVDLKAAGMSDTSSHRGTTHSSTGIIDTDSSTDGEYATRKDSQVELPRTRSSAHMSRISENVIEWTFKNRKSKNMEKLSSPRRRRSDSIPTPEKRRQSYNFKAKDRRSISNSSRMSRRKTLANVPFQRPATSKTDFFVPPQRSRLKKILFGSAYTLERNFKDKAYKKLLRKEIEDSRLRVKKYEQIRLKLRKSQEERMRNLHEMGISGPLLEPFSTVAELECEEYEILLQRECRLSGLLFLQLDLVDQRGDSGKSYDNDTTEMEDETNLYPLPHKMYADDDEGQRLLLVSTNNDLRCDKLRELCVIITDEFIVERTVHERREQLDEILKLESSVNSSYKTVARKPETERELKHHSKLTKGVSSNETTAKVSENISDVKNKPKLDLPGAIDLATNSDDILREENDNEIDISGSVAGKRGYQLFAHDCDWSTWQLCVFTSVVADQRTREGRLLHAFLSQHLGIWAHNRTEKLSKMSEQEKTASMLPPSVLSAFCAYFQQIVEAKYGFDKESAQWKMKEGKVLSLLISRVVFCKANVLCDSYYSHAVKARAQMWSDHVWENTTNKSLADFQVAGHFIPKFTVSNNDEKKSNGESRVEVAHDDEEDDDLCESISENEMNRNPASVIMAQWSVYEPAFRAFIKIFDSDSPVGMGKSLLVFVKLLHNCAKQASGGKSPDGLDELFPLIVACASKKWIVAGETAHASALRLHRGLAYLEMFLVDHSGEVAFYLCSVLAAVSHLSKQYGIAASIHHDGNGKANSEENLASAAAESPVLSFSSKQQAEATKALRTFILHSDMQEDLSDTLLGF